MSVPPDIAAQLERDRVGASARLADRRAQAPVRPTEPAVTRATTVSETPRPSKPDAGSVDAQVIGAGGSGAGGDAITADDLAEIEVAGTVNGAPATVTLLAYADTNTDWIPV